MKKKRKIILIKKYITESEKSDFEIKKDEHTPQQINYCVKLQKKAEFIIYSKLKNHYKTKEFDDITDENVLEKTNSAARYSYKKISKVKAETITTRQKTNTDKLIEIHVKILMKNCDAAAIKTVISKETLNKLIKTQIHQIVEKQDEITQFIIDIKLAAQTM